MIENAEEALKVHQIFAEQILRNPLVSFARRKSDVEECFAGIKVILGLQHMPCKMTSDVLRALRDDSLRIGAIAYQSENEYGSGYATHGGLKQRGEWLIRQFAELGIILDLSHANEQTAMNAMRLIHREDLPVKVMLSHSGCHSVYMSPRNVSNAVLSAVADLDGYCGIPAITFIIAAKGSYYPREFVYHVQYATQMMGSKRVGIGSDCQFLDMSIIDAQKKALQNHAGFSDDVLQGVLGNNFRYFLHRSLPRI